RSFNRNQPFNEFTIEQLAGDLLPNPTDDQLIATGFQRCNITTNEGGTIAEENLANYAVDRVQTFGWVYLGLTTNCSQCHDHKFDPISMKDFYSLAAFFRNTTQGPLDGNTKDGRGPVLMVPSEPDRQRWQALPDEIAAAKQARETRKNTARPEFDAWASSATADSLGEGPSEEGLQVHYLLNEGSGKEVASALAPAQKLSADGELTWIPDGKAGPAPVIKPGSTFNLGGAGDFELNQPFSYGVWIKPANDSASGGILARMDEQAQHRGYDLWQNGNAYSVHIIDNWPDNAFKVTTQNATVKPGTWQHLFATYDGSGTPAGVKIYIDGEEQKLRVDTNSIKPGASLHTETPLRIGQRSQGAVLDGAALQDVRVYARTLSAAEVKILSGNAALRAILAVAADQRTEEQKQALFDHYLNTIDPEFPALARTVSEREAEYEAIKTRSPVTHIQKEKMDSQAMAYILTRGEYDRPTEQVIANTPASMHPMSEGAPANRLGLAQWVVDPANPLTARVTVNRFWQQVFGQGIVSTPEDLGVMGALPSNQALLDWLAVEFQDTGWDVKRLFKLMFMSATYRQAAIVTPEKLERDGDNALLSRGPRFRMDAEMIRDYALVTSGLLNQKMYGPSVKPYQPTNIWDIVGLPGGDTRNYVQSQGEDLYRRTVYSFWKRMAPPPNMEALNAPSREVCTVRRERTNTPLQALVTLNDPQFVEAARVLAVKVMAAGEVEQGIQLLGMNVLGRPFSPEEQAILVQCHQEFLTHYQAHTEAAGQLIATGESPVAAGMDPANLAAWTMVCNQVLNLDETLNK
ncbi:MAG: DUF1553 domain-containing protein, partial [Planctomycetaceae bacterium]|nr:DUF1553 domain-containing protein [Planctomycetaceae bacterium]